MKAAWRDWLAAPALAFAGSCLPYCGVLLVFFIPFALVGLPRTLWLLLKVPARRADLAVRLLAWTLALGGSFGLHLWYWEQAYAGAAPVAAAIQRHHDRTGAWPPDLAALGIDPAASLRTRSVEYCLSGGVPGLRYAATFAPNEYYYFHFPSGSWHYPNGRSPRRPAGLPIASHFAGCE